jgi:hypothetical protein
LAVAVRLALAAQDQAPLDQTVLTQYFRPSHQLVVVAVEMIMVPLEVLEAAVDTMEQAVLAPLGKETTVATVQERLERAWTVAVAVVARVGLAPMVAGQQAVMAAQDHRQAFLDRLSLTLVAAVAVFTIPRQRLEAVALAAAVLVVTEYQELLVETVAQTLVAAVVVAVHLRQTSTEEAAQAVLEL